MLSLPPNKDMLDWCNDEWNKGNRIKASKINKIMSKMTLLKEIHHHKQFCLNNGFIYDGPTLQMPTVTPPPIRIVREGVISKRAKVW
jgi:hypothetical protein